MASLAAILAIGKPVALEASARGARDPRVHLDDDDPAVVGVDGELDVAAAGVDADLADDADARCRACRWYSRSVSVIAGRDGDRVAGVHAHRVEVLDRADDHDVVVPVAHQLELVLLPAEDRLLEEHLGGRAGVPGPRRRCGAGRPRRRRSPEPAPPIVKDGRTTTG